MFTFINENTYLTTITTPSCKGNRRPHVQNSFKYTKYKRMWD